MSIGIFTATAIVAWEMFTITEEITVIKEMNVLGDTYDKEAKVTCWQGFYSDYKSCRDDDSDSLFADHVHRLWLRMILLGIMSAVNIFVGFNKFYEKQSRFKLMLCTDEKSRMIWQPTEEELKKMEEKKNPKKEEGSG